jgi:hypothetical protein
MIALLWFVGSSPAYAGEPETDMGVPPGRYKITSEDGKIEIPFKLFRGDVWFLGEMNGKEVRMLIDNGLLWDPILFFGSERVDSLGMAYEGVTDVVGGGVGEAVPSRTASGITIRFPGVEFYDQTAVITSYIKGAPNLWEGCEGQVSGTFFKHFVVEFDFDRMTLTLTKPDTFKYKGDGVALPMVQLPSGVWSIPADLELVDGRVISLDLAMDLGEGKPFFIIHDLEHNIGLPNPALEGSLGFGMSGEILGHYGRIKSVTIGGHKIRNVIAGFASKDYGGQYFAEATVGLALLDHFNFTYDYPHSRMYLEPNRRFNLPFEHEMTGMTMRLGQEGYFTINRVYGNGPASEAGLKVGDRISHIDGKPAGNWEIWTMIPYMRQAGKVVTFTRVNETGSEDIKLTLRRVI